MAKAQARKRSARIITDGLKDNIATIEGRMRIARQQLARVDGLTYLSQLIQAREPETAGKKSSLRWMTFPEALSLLSMDERRRLLAAAAKRLVILQDDDPFCECEWERSATAFAEMGTGMSRVWAQTGGWMMPDAGEWVGCINTSR